MRGRFGAEEEEMREDRQEGTQTRMEHGRNLVSGLVGRILRTSQRPTGAAAGKGRAVVVPASGYGTGRPVSIEPDGAACGIE